MKEFDLKAALNGEPVKLRGGFKAIIYYRVPDELSYPGGSTEPYPLIGIIFNKDGTIKSASENWKDCGAYTVNQGGLDIIGMWEEPKIIVEDLPKPFKPKLGEYYYRITSRSFYDTLDIREKEYTDPEYDDKTVNQGNAFRTREDAQKWLDFMKSKLE